MTDVPPSVSRQSAWAVISRFLRSTVLPAVGISGLATCAATLHGAEDPNKVNQAFNSPLKSDMVDSASLAAWEGGRETPIPLDQRTGKYEALWTDKTSPGNAGLSYGVSNVPGVRHLRIGFLEAVPVGTVLAVGGGSLSVLKPDVAYPGDLSDDSQWEPAQRLINGKISQAELGITNYAWWILPPATKTRALRFTHKADQTDLSYAGVLGGALILKERYDNEANRAATAASAFDQTAGRVNNGESETVNTGWASRDHREPPSGSETPVSPSNAPWIVLTWAKPQVLSGLVALQAGFSSAEVQVYTGTDDRSPRDADDSAWKTIVTYDGIKPGGAFWPVPLMFDSEVKTRAVRLRMTGPLVRPDAQNGTRVWVGELAAMSPLGDRPLQDVVSPTTEAAVESRIPIKFHLDRAGFVTLVIEKPDGQRIRNLIADTHFPAGDNVAWWDGSDDLGRDVDATMHGVYNIPARLVTPGQYRVRGLVRDEIKAFYEFSVYVTGNPPWNTADTTGAWLANHTPPQAAVYLPPENSPTGQPAVYLGCFVTEGPAGLAWVDLDGRKLGGKKWIGGHWTAAPYLARDGGERAMKGVYAYVASVWETAKNSGQYELRLTAVAVDGDKPVAKIPLETDPATLQVGGAVARANIDNEIGGLAVRDGLLVVSRPLRGELLFVDARRGEVLGTLPLKNPRGVAFDAQGRLLATSGQTLVRYGLFDDFRHAGQPKVLVTAGLEDPFGLTFDEAGNVYISDRGNSHQVKVFSMDGKLLRTIGKPGVPAPGPYDPLRMNHPAGLTIDSRQQLWVTEQNFMPKRVSVWSLDGKLIRAFYGPGKYGGGGTLDPRDKKLFYYVDDEHGAMEFQLDWEKGTYDLKSIYYLLGPDEMKLPFRNAGPETPLYHNGKRYFTNCYNSSPTGGASTSFVFNEKDGIARPSAGMGRAADWDLLKTDEFKSCWPDGVDLNAKAPKSQAFFIWSDLNSDAQAQPDEVTIQKGDASGVTVMPDLSFCIAQLGGTAVKFSPTRMTETGGPVYDIAKGQILAEGVLPPNSSGGNQVLTSPDGWSVITLGIAPFDARSLSGAKDRVPMWSYPSPWPGLHASHRAPRPDRAGQLIGTTRLMGGFFEPEGSQVGPLWAINSNHGRVSVFTQDGLLVATLFEDMREGKAWRMPSAARNMSLEGMTLGEENFWPTITSTSDGKAYIVDGARSAIIRLDGLETARRIPNSEVTVSKEDLEKCRVWALEVEAARQQASGGGVLKVAMANNAPIVDGLLTDWSGADWVDIDKNGVRAYFSATSKPYDVTAAVAVAGDRLYAAWRTNDEKLLENSGEMPVAPFKTGGALDLMISSDTRAPADRRNPVAGDARLLVTVIGGKPKAMLYRPVVPGTKESDKVPFSSPSRTILFDQVEDISSQVEFARSKGDYEVSVPLATLGLQPKTGLTVKGDIGILRGNGTETTSRVYWSNKATGITADVPAEAALTPTLWGTFEFKSR